MPNVERPDYERVDLFLPRDLVEAARKKSGADGLTVMIGRLLSKATGVKYAPRRRGRPKKAETDE